VADSACASAFLPQFFAKPSMAGTPMFFKGIKNNISLLMHKVQNYRSYGSY